MVQGVLAVPAAGAETGDRLHEITEITFEDSGGNLAGFMRLRDMIMQGGQTEPT